MLVKNSNFARKFNFGCESMRERTKRVQRGEETPSLCVPE